MSQKKEISHQKIGVFLLFFVVATMVFAIGKAAEQQ
jgi:hypothetical protein